MTFIVKPLEIAQIELKDEVIFCPDYGCSNIGCYSYDPCPWLCFGYACGIVT